jgi:DNA-binding response OmpR family regulator
MADSILKGKKILVVDDEPDVVAMVEDEILQSCPDCTVDKSLNYEKAAELLGSQNYDIVVLDIMGVRGFDLLEIAVKKKLKVAMLTAHALSADSLKKSHDMGAMAYLPKEKMGEIVPFLEDVLTYEFKTGWRRYLDKLEKYFNEKLESDWKTKANTSYWY